MDAILCGLSALCCLTSWTAAIVFLIGAFQTFKEACEYGSSSVPTGILAIATIVFYKLGDWFSVATIFFWEHLGQ